MKKEKEPRIRGDSLSADSEGEALSEGADPESRAAEILEKESRDWVAELDSKDKEIEALSDRLLRLTAEFENFKKRTAKERMELIKFANEGLLIEVVPVLDSLERAIRSAKENVSMGSLVEGLELVRRLFTAFLEKAGVTEIRAQGGAFNPEFHEAISVVESGTYPDNTVVEEVQKGYLLNSRVLRPAMVRVAKSLSPEENDNEGEES
jgi:molecular chaperone GrpE